MVLNLDSLFIFLETVNDVQNYSNAVKNFVTRSLIWNSFEEKVMLTKLIKKMPVDMTFR